MKSTVHEFYERKMAEIFDSNLSNSTKAKILKLLSDDIKRTSCVGGIKTCVYSSSNENCFYCNKLNKDIPNGNKVGIQLPDCPYIELQKDFDDLMKEYSKQR